MAASLGSLVVSLGLDAAEFTTGLTKSEYEARKFAERLDKGIAQGARAAGIALAAMGAAGLAAITAIDQLAKSAGDFQDLAEKTGTNAEALASFAVAAGTAGTSMEEVAKASILLTKNLTGVDDESKAAGAALTALGIPIKEFKALDPAAQIEAVSKALAGFADGAAKTAVATALFGKAGAELLPFLKELENQGGRTVILTQKQIEQADEYADKQAKARAELQLYAQALAIQALPAINAVTTAAKEFVGELVGISRESGKLAADNGVKEFAEGAARSLAFVVDAVDGVTRAFLVVGNVIGATAAQLQALASGDLKAFKAIQAEASKTIDDIIAKQTFSARLEAQFARQAADARGRAQEDRGFRPPGRQLSFQGAERNTGAGAARERTTEAERYLESLTKQLEKTQELTVFETALLEIQKGRLKGITPDVERAILETAKQIDAYHDLKKSIEEGNKAFEAEKRALDESEKARVRNIQSMEKESQAILDANEDLRDEIAIILGGEQARVAIEKARISSAIAIKEEALALAQLNPLMKTEAALLKGQIEALRERQELIDGRSFAKQLAEDAKQLQDFKNLFADTFADAFAQFIDGTKSAKDAFKDFERSIAQSLSRIAAQNIADAIFGGKNGGGFDLSKAFSGLFSGMSSDIGSMFGGMFASGGMPPIGKASLVGERGPELFVPRAAGQIIPNERLGMGAMNMTVNVLPGADTRSARQAAVMAGDAVRTAMGRR